MGVGVGTGVGVGGGVTQAVSKQRGPPFET